MTAPLHDAATFRYESWELRPQERLLLVQGEPARIGGRAFDVLHALARRDGRVATKTELIDEAWPGLVVEENNLSVQIATLRKLLGAAAIATVAGVGYRLADVRPMAERSPPQVHASGPSAPFVGTPRLYGREADIEALNRLIGGHRLVSIVGPGGVGKTVLARQLIHQWADRWPEGARWLDLSPLRPGAPLGHLLARAFGMATDGMTSAPEDLAGVMTRHQALVVLDNCEHLLEDVGGLVQAFMAHAPGLRWLVTSQVPIHVQGEWVHRLEPLSLPTAGAPPEQLRLNPSVSMLVERIAATGRPLEPTDAVLETLAEICRKLDGLPLAIEMVAPRVGSLGLSSIRDQLSRRLRLSSKGREVSPRHQTLLNTYEWSFNLLDAESQALFAWLHPFRGGFTLAAAQVMVRRMPAGAAHMGEWEVLDALSSLVDKSLVQRAGEPSDRFQLLESARDFAHVQLDEAGQVGACLAAHAAVVIETFETAVADLERMHDRQWGDRYLPERHNVMAALTWACSGHDPALLAPLVTALSLLDIFAQTQCEVVGCPIPVEQLLQAPVAARARACLEFGWAHYLDGNREQGTVLMRQALEDFESLGDAVGAYQAMARLIRLYESRPDTSDQAQALWLRMQASDTAQLPLRVRLNCTIIAGLQYGGRTLDKLWTLHDLAVRAGYDALAAGCRANITDELLVQFRFADAADTAARMVQDGEPRARTRGLLRHNQALALVQLGRVEEARHAARDMLRVLPSMAHLVLDLFALVAAREGRHADAALVLGRSERLRRERDVRSDPAELAVIAETHQLLGAALDPAGLADLLNTGSSMSTPDAVSLALDQSRR